MMDEARALPGKTNIVAVEEVPHDRVDQYGVVGVGERKGKMFSITSMVEKPPIDRAPSNLILTGRYILQPEILELLAKQERGAGGEIQLTDAMIQLAKTQPFYGLQVRRPQLRLRLQDRLPRRQRLLRARPRGHRAGLPRRDQEVLGQLVLQGLRPVSPITADMPECASPSCSTRSSSVNFTSRKSPKVPCNSARV